MGLLQQKFIAIALCCTILLVTKTVSHAAAPRNGQPAPAFKTVTTTGQPITLEKYRGQVVLLDFFATWCQPCRAAIPHLAALNNKFGRQGLQIIGMNADDQGEKLISNFIAEQKISYPVALAGDALLTDYGVRAVPVLYLIDKKGQVAEVFRGYSDEIGRSLEQLIKKLLAAK